ncbi:hypothetical protein SISNIDRAFT_490926 [Sistotremastrum niveocremeum HHB9708]|uniref:Uncharacterized protein n=1 Tax=Sistotremastrum niveocremeum HHB9708 TaxID=1314777 RepID=A0A164NCD7_9AGAM|nr:hypothetical protein SISNIDRAFT_490926 [Sistotremastrum niveocremeum HHB9708]
MPPSKHSNHLTFENGSQGDTRDPSFSVVFRWANRYENAAEKSGYSLQGSAIRPIHENLKYPFVASGRCIYLLWITFVLLPTSALVAYSVPTEEARHSTTFSEPEHHTYTSAPTHASPIIVYTSRILQQTDQETFSQLKLFINPPSCHSSILKGDSSTPTPNIPISQWSSWSPALKFIPHKSAISFFIRNCSFK